MGTCCSVKDSKYDYKDEIFTNNNNILQTENKFNNFNLKFDEDLDLTNYNMHLNNLIFRFENSNLLLGKFTLERLFNILKYHKDDFSLSEYILFDLRLFKDKKENFFKKLKTINYSLQELLLIEGNAFNNLKKFIYEKQILIICDETKLNDCHSFLSLLNENKVKCKIFFLINEIKEFKKNKIHLNQNLLNLMDYKSFNLLPYILLSLRYFPNLKSESLIFIEFFTNFKRFNNENLEKEKKSDNLKNLKNFIKEQKISLIIDITKEENNSNNNSLNIKDLDFSCKILRMKLNNKNDFLNFKDNLIQKLNSIKLELSLNRSIIIQIDENIEKELVLCFLVFLIEKITDVKYYSLLDFYNNNFLFLNKLNDLLSNTK